MKFQYLILPSEGPIDWSKKDEWATWVPTEKTKPDNSWALRSQSVIDEMGYETRGTGERKLWERLLNKAKAEQDEIQPIR